MAEQLTLNQLVGSSSLPRLTSTLITKEPVRIVRTGSPIRVVALVVPLKPWTAGRYPVPIVWSSVLRNCVFVLAVLVSLAACGAGSGSSPSSTPPALSAFQKALLDTLDRVEADAKLLRAELGVSDKKKAAARDVKDLQSAIAAGRAWLAANSLPPCLASLAKPWRLLLDQADHALAAATRKNKSSMDELNKLPAAAQKLGAAWDSLSC